MWIAVSVYFYLPGRKLGLQNIQIVYLYVGLLLLKDYPPPNSSPLLYALENNLLGFHFDTVILSQKSSYSIKGPPAAFA